VSNWQTTVKRFFTQTRPESIPGDSGTSSPTRGTSSCYRALKANRRVHGREHGLAARSFTAAMATRGIASAHTRRAMARSEKLATVNRKAPNKHRHSSGRSAVVAITTTTMKLGCGTKKARSCTECKPSRIKNAACRPTHPCESASMATAALGLGSTKRQDNIECKSEHGR